MYLDLVLRSIYINVTSPVTLITCTKKWACNCNHASQGHGSSLSTALSNFTQALIKTLGVYDSKSLFFVLNSCCLTFWYF